jgi:hypothetical protein
MDSDPLGLIFLWISVTFLYGSGYFVERKLSSGFFTVLKMHRDIPGDGKTHEGSVTWFTSTHV